MRKPFTREECSRSLFWTAALAGEKPLIHDHPEAGFYRRKLVRNGPWVPARIWIVQEVGDCGELLNPPVYRCELNGRPADAVAQWLYLCNEPISESEYAYLLDLGRWAVAYAPEDAMANPDREVDWLTHPPPLYTPKGRKK